MKRLFSFAVLTLALVVGAHAQYRPSGPPASVTSTQPAPVTGAPVFEPGPTVTSGSFSPQFPPTIRARSHRGHGGNHGGIGGNHGGIDGTNGRFGTQFVPAWAGGGFIPVPVPVDANGNPIQVTDQSAMQDDEGAEEDGPAYTVFERRSYSAVPLTDYADMRAVRPAQISTTQRTDVPVEDQPPTVLIFRDGHQLEITNYAIQSGTLFNLSDSGPRKIALADLDVDRTIKANDARGVDFTLPTAR